MPEIEIQNRESFESRETLGSLIVHQTNDNIKKEEVSEQSEN